MTNYYYSTHSINPELQTSPQTEREMKEGMQPNGGLQRQHDRKIERQTFGNSIITLTGR